LKRVTELVQKHISAGSHVMAVLDMIRKEFNVDERRIYLMGHSTGGAGTYYLGTKVPEYLGGSRTYRARSNGHDERPHPKYSRPSRTDGFPCW
jgi:predicted peptidase